MKNTVIFVHGFGVMKDARGMFTEISGGLSLKGIDSVLVDLNTLDAEGNIVLNNLSDQVDILRRTRSTITEGSVDLICHSLGCVVAALADLPHIRRTIFLAPPTENDISKTVDYFSRNSLTVFDMDGISRLARRDGTFTIVPQEFWLERKTLDFKNLYQRYVNHNEVYVVRAALDDVISNKDVAGVFEGSLVIELKADHDFKDDARSLLVSLCEEIVTR